MEHGVREIIRNLRLLDGDRMKVSVSKSGHFTRDRAFVVSRLIEGERKRLDGRSEFRAATPAREQESMPPLR